MNPKRPHEEQDEKHLCLDQSRTTGIFHWQEFAFLDFKDLMELAQETHEFQDGSELDYFE